VNFTTKPITRELFLKAGWQEDEDTAVHWVDPSGIIFDQLMIVVNANTGGIVRKEVMTTLDLEGSTSIVPK
jgi:hypothetical protein